MGIGMGMAWHDTSMMQAQERSAERRAQDSPDLVDRCLGQRREAVGARGDREAREVASLVELTG
jgi:hypothetical protein